MGSERMEIRDQLGQMITLSTPFKKDKDVSRLEEMDKFDVDTGCLIAFARAKNKLYNSFFKRANTYVQAIDRRLGEAINMFNDFGLKLEENKEALESHIKELTEPDEEDEDE